MATTRKYAQGSVNPPASALNCFYRPEMVVSGADQTQAAADIAQIFDALAGFLILAVSMEVLTPEGGTLTVDVGLTAVDADGWLDGVNGNAAAAVKVSSAQTYTSGTTSANVIASATTLYGLVGAKYMATADTVDALFNDEADTAVLRFTMACIDMNGLMTFAPTPTTI